MKATTNGKYVCEFDLATNRPVIRDGERVTDFIRCQVWNKQAKNLAHYQGKGSLIAVEGNIRTDSYEYEGKRKYKTYVLVNNIEFLESKKETNNENLTVQQEETNPYKEFGEQIQIDDEDLPF